MKNLSNITKALLLIISLAFILPLNIQAQENKKKLERVSGHSIEVYKFKSNKLSEAELQSQVMNLSGVKDIIVDMSKSTIVIQFDNNKNSKKNLKKSLKKLGLSGDFQKRGQFDADYRLYDDSDENRRKDKDSNEFGEGDREEKYNDMRE